MHSAHRQESRAIDTGEARKRSSCPRPRPWTRRASALGACIALLASACGGGGGMYRSAAPSSPSYEADASAAMAEEGVILTASVGGRAELASAPASAPASASGAAPQASAAPQADATPKQEQLVVEGWLRIEVEDLSASAAAIRAEVEGQGGRVTSEQLDGGATSSTGHLAIKLPPGRVPAFLDWLAAQGTLRSKRIQSTDVSRQLFDQEIALKNLEHTLSRMHAVLDREGLGMQDILAIETQMTRLRGEIERIKGEKRFLEHRVAFATLTIDLRRPAGAPAVLGDPARVKLYPGPRLSALVLLDPGGRERVRLGGGVQVRLHRQVPLELDVFADADGTGRGVLATTGGVLYSDFLGRGQRRFLNPYLELRMGYAHVTGHAFAFGAGAGLELFKHKYMQVDLSTRVLGLLGAEFTPALVSGGSVVFAF